MKKKNILGRLQMHISTGFDKVCKIRGIKHLSDFTNAYLLNADSI